MRRNLSLHWLKEGNKIHDLRTMLEVLCYNDTLDTV